MQDTFSIPLAVHGTLDVYMVTGQVPTLEADQCDAARYRWLRANGDCDQVVTVLDEFHGVTRLLKTEELDAAIDTAIERANK